MRAAALRRRLRLGGLGLVAACILASVLLRLPGMGAAIAQGSVLPAAGHAAASCIGESALGDLIEELNLRAARLDQRETALEDRLQALAVSEAALEETRAALVAAETQLLQTLALADTAAERDIARMTAVYEAMKPRQAAQLFEAMPAEFAAGYLAAMRTEAAAAVLSGMNPEAAFAVSLVLTARNAGLERD